MNKQNKVQIYTYQDNLKITWLIYDHVSHRENTVVYKYHDK